MNADCSLKIEVVINEFKFQTEVEVNGIFPSFVRSAISILVS